MEKPVCEREVKKWKSLSRVRLSPYDSPGQPTGVGSLSLLHGIFQPRDRTGVSHVAGGFFTSWATREAQEYWSGYPVPSPGDLPDPGIKPRSLTLQADSLPAEPQGKALIYRKNLSNKPINGYLLRDLRYKVSTCHTSKVHTTLDPKHQKTTAEDADLSHQRIINTSRINLAILICIIWAQCHNPCKATEFCMWICSSQNANVYRVWSEKAMAAHTSVLAWRIPGMAEPGGLPSMGSHRVERDWSDLA